MEFKGFPIPPVLRRLAGEMKHESFDDETVAHRLRGDIPAKLLERIDALQITARQRLGDFLASYTPGQESRNSRGWSRVRDYKRPGTGLQIMRDPIAPDSIVVKHIFITDVDTEEEHQHERPFFYWVATEKDDQHGVPFVYYADPELQDDQATRWTVKPFSTKFTSRADATRFAEMSFFCHSPNPQTGDNTRTEFEVWKQGKALGEKKREQTPSTRRVAGLVLNPDPIPIR